MPDPAPRPLEAADIVAVMALATEAQDAQQALYAVAARAQKTLRHRQSSMFRYIFSLVEPSGIEPLTS